MKQKFYELPLLMKAIAFAVALAVYIFTATNAAMGAYSAGVPNATTAEAQAGTNDSKFMTPKDVRDAIQNYASFPAGTLIQRVVSTYTANADLGAASAIPMDDTIPQNTEGTEILTVAITARATGNIIRITLNGFGAGANGGGTCALFKDTGANAIQATTMSLATTVGMSLVYEEAAADTAAHTYKIRCGENGSANSMRMNGTNAARLFGGVAATYLIADEFKV